ncbi:hypothetical protein WJX74_007472 [Apatococcus lobatus]|uniref:Uncharacterized protein n=1 Tax=Apatococcus lobatus TaxID=904363 RepID=A0AAW1RPS3_9CHLO
MNVEMNEAANSKAATQGAQLAVSRQLADESHSGGHLGAVAVHASVIPQKLSWRVRLDLSQASDSKGPAVQVRKMQPLFHNQMITQHRFASWRRLSILRHTLHSYQSWQHGSQHVWRTC